jgi:hypothetical protein
MFARKRHAAMVSAVRAGIGLPSKNIVNVVSADPIGVNMPTPV